MGDGGEELMWRGRRVEGEAGEGVEGGGDGGCGGGGVEDEALDVGLQFVLL